MRVLKVALLFGRRDGYARSAMTRSPGQFLSNTAFNTVRERDARTLFFSLFAGAKFLAPNEPRIHPAYYYGGRPEVRFNDVSSPFSSIYWRQHFDKVDHERHTRFDMGRDLDEVPTGLGFA